MSKTERSVWTGFRRKPNRNGPVTNPDSQTVMLAAERSDNIEITDIVEEIVPNPKVPDEVSVIKRTETYYGPELLVHSAYDSEDRNYLLTAPGPTTHLCLWAGELNEDTGKRQGWYPAAEIKATLDTEQPPYETCDQCGELIRTIYHEREAVLGQCSRA